jgi:hypothetical protein
MLILWSGGLDSTYLLIKTLIEQQDSPHVIRTISLNCPQISGSKKCRGSRNKIKKILNDEGWKFFHTEISLSYESKRYWLGPAGEDGIAQPAIWAFLGLIHAMPEETLYLGYVSGDVAIQYLHEIKGIASEYNSITRKGISISFPIINMEKSEIIENMMSDKVQKKCLENIWFCQGDESRPCGECQSCIRHNRALTLSNTSIRK